MINIKYLGNGKFEGKVDFVNGEVAPYIEIECGPKTCRYDDAGIMYEEVCRYIERFTKSQKVTTDNVISNCVTELDRNGIKYIRQVCIQIKISI